MRKESQGEPSRPSASGGRYHIPAIAPSRRPRPHGHLGLHGRDGGKGGLMLVGEIARDGGVYGTP